MEKIICISLNFKLEVFKSYVNSTVMLIIISKKYSFSQEIMHHVRIRLSNLNNANVYFKEYYFYSSLMVI